MEFNFCLGGYVVKHTATTSTQNKVDFLTANQPVCLIFESRNSRNFKFSFSRRYASERLSKIFINMMRTLLLKKPRLILSLILGVLWCLQATHWMKGSCWSSLKPILFILLFNPTSSLHPLASVLTQTAVSPKAVSSAVAATRVVTCLPGRCEMTLWGLKWWKHCPETTTRLWGSPVTTKWSVFDHMVDTIINLTIKILLEFSRYYFMMYKSTFQAYCDATYNLIIISTN